MFLYFFNDFVVYMIHFLDLEHWVAQPIFHLVFYHIEIVPRGSSEKKIVPRELE